MPADPPAHATESHMSHLRDKGRNIGEKMHLSAAKQPHKFLHGHLVIDIVEANNLIDADLLGVSDPYVCVFFGQNKADNPDVGMLARTKVISNDLNPKFNEHFEVNVCGAHSHLAFVVWDKDQMSSDMIGYCTLPITELGEGEMIEKELALKGKKSKLRCGGSKDGGTLTVRLKYVKGVIRSDAFEVPNTYFKAEKCRIVPFQSTTVLPGQLPSVPYDGGVYEPGSYWREMHANIMKAKKFIYITGWSVWTELKMLRDGSEHDIILGELLKRKAEEGVRVCVMIWNEAASINCPGMTSGVLMTHDEITTKFFKGTKVHCANVERPSGPAKFIGDLFNFLKSTLFTHHQKTLIADEDDKAIAYVGGIDLADGRFDTPDKSIFRSLQGPHKEDFHQCMVMGTTLETGPREPWQDCGAKLIGPVVAQVITNFEERWHQQRPKESHALLDLEAFKKKTLHDTGSAPAERARDAKSSTEGAEWQGQIFRSIDERAAKFDMESAGGGNLHRNKGRFVDTSIQKAYVHHIRRAKRFVYLENQYFMGGSQSWIDKQQKKGCENLVPLEIVYKINSKIRNNEPFAVYITIPMWPEGDPHANPIPTILHWQYCTVQMMYSKIGECLREVGSDKHPQDYLNFFCLGTRETDNGCQSHPEAKAETDHGINAHKFRRCPIYCHSKLCVVDDEYFMMGSANLNERSMRGTRDTEIMFGGWQPQYVVDSATEGARGVVHAYRMTIFAEHLGLRNMADLEKVRDPHKPETVKLIREISEDAKRKFCADEITDMSRGAHLLPYPYRISKDGSLVTGWDECKDGCFLDTKAKIDGVVSKMMPTILTM